MQLVRLGPSGVEISTIVLGTAHFGYNVHPDGALAQLYAARDAGVTTIDTADAYSTATGPFHAAVEEWLGRHIGNDERFVIITKGGYARGAPPVRSMAESRLAAGAEVADEGSGPSYLRRAVEDSLRRLRRDRIDVYHLHRWDPNTPLAESLGVLGDLQREGKIRSIGCSNFTGDQLTAAVEVDDGIETVQAVYNLLERSPEDGLLPLCAARDIHAVPFQVLAAGFLAGHYRHDVPPAPASRFGLREIYREMYWNDANFAALARLRELAAERRLSAAQLALVWALSRPGVSAAAVGFDDTAQLAQLAAVADQRLTTDEAEAVAAAVHPTTSVD